MFVSIKGEAATHQTSRDHAWAPEAPRCSQSGGEGLWPEGKVSEAEVEVEERVSDLEESSTRWRLERRSGSLAWRKALRGGGLWSPAVTGTFSFVQEELEAA